MDLAIGTSLLHYIKRARDLGLCSHSGSTQDIDAVCDLDFAGES